MMIGSAEDYHMKLVNKYLDGWYEGTASAHAGNEGIEEERKKKKKKREGLKGPSDAPKKEYPKLTFISLSIRIVMSRSIS